MAWEKRGKGTCYYRSVRLQGRVVKRYCGGGIAGRQAAQWDATRRAQDREDRETERREIDRLDRAISMCRRIHRMCELLTAASLLVAGYYRPSRHGWRKRRHGKPNQE